ncbi:MAG TPA: hypothetical protein VG797_06690 [Phycisphaerales bacterium]|nr:hypothetical protein [Phycisphaerales bacterium]
MEPIENGLTTADVLDDQEGVARRNSSILVHVAVGDQKQRALLRDDLSVVQRDRVEDEVRAIFGIDASRHHEEFTLAVLIHIGSIEQEAAVRGDVHVGLGGVIRRRVDGVHDFGTA